MKSLLKNLITALMACFFALLGTAHAKDWPNKPIKLIVPFPAAGGTDAVARALANKLSQQFNQSVIVENKAGANGVIGAEMVANSAPDGYTVLLTIASHAIAPAVSKKLPYDTEKDFAAVSLIAKYPYLLTVPANSPANTFKEFIEQAKKNPGKIAYASSGSGSGPHLGMELLIDATDINLIHAPYKGAAPANNDLVGGQVQAMLNNLMAGSGLIRAKKLKVLAVTSSTRSPALPDVPTIKELGYPKYEVDGWYGVFVPAKTPPEIIKQLSLEIAKALKDPEVLNRLSGDGAITIGSTPQEFNDFFIREKNQWAKLAKKIQLEMD
jgi:tripartite-type tricarboxylate transporter receptor subunit TctC